MAENEVKLYELTVLVKYHAVIAATSEQDALDHVDSWENAWHDNADLIGVTDLDVCDVRDATSVVDEAHEVTMKAKSQQAGDA